MKTAVAVFLRVPCRGEVKTRLSAVLDEGFVLELYKGFVLDLLDRLKEMKHTVLFYWPGEKKGEIKGWLGDTFLYLPQKGDTLGEKMANAFEEMFLNGYEAALLMGSDIPELDTGIVKQALVALEKRDAVIGPSGDGGFYLIGFRPSVFSKKFFAGIPWSTSRVLDGTLTALERGGVSHTLLPRLNDIDTPEDFNRLVHRVGRGKKVGHRTRKNLLVYRKMGT